MADELDKYLGSITGQALSTGPAPVTSGAGTDELGTYLDKLHSGGGGLPDTVTLPAAPDPAGAPVKSPQEEEALAQLDLMLPKKGYFETLGDLYSGGVKRNIAQIQAMPDMISSLYNAYQGNEEVAVEQAKRAIATEGSAGKPQYDLSKVNDLEDFSYWLTEKLGENAATTVAMGFTGVVGGLLAKGGMATVGSMAPAATKSLVERGLITEGTRRATLMAGAAIPTYALTTSLETSGTGSEIFEATGTLAPELSLAAGAAKGALELWGPMSVAKSLISPNLVLGKTVSGAIGKLMLKEGTTELVQEGIDITARKMMDPKYNFFDSGVDDWFSFKHPGVLRLTEAGLAGGLVGGVYGGPFAKREQDAKVQKPGEYKTLPGDPAARGDPDFVGKIAGALQEGEPPAPVVRPMLDFPAMAKGPISALRDLVLPPDKTKDVRASTAVGNPLDDLMGLAPLLRTASPGETTERLWDMLDKNTQRFVIRRGDGKFDSEVMTSAELELHNVVNYTQDVKPDYNLVNPASLSAAGITARIFDIGKDGEYQDFNRVWFLPDVSPEEKGALKAEYVQMVKELTGTAATALQDKAGYQAIEETFRPRYQELLNRGLRVLPTRGAGFYYGGSPMAADPFDPTVSRRNFMVGTYDPKTRAFSTFTPSLNQRFSGPDQVTYDRTRLPGMVGGIPVAIDMDKIDSTTYTITPRGIVFNAPISLSQVTPGVDFGSQLGLARLDYESDVFMKKPIAKGKSQFRNDIVADDSPMLRKYEEILKNLVPVMDKIIKSLGLEFAVELRLTSQEMQGSPAWVYGEYGVIMINPYVFQKNLARFRGTEENTLRTAIMHELGHLVAVAAWKKMDLAQQGQLLYAWEKAHLARRMDAPSWDGKRLGDTRAINGSVQNATGLMAPRQSYYYSFTEWLAEQFRRFAEADPQVLNWQDEALKGGARTMEKFYTEWAKEFGKDSAINLRNPDYYFTAVMEYFRWQTGDTRRDFKLRQAQRELYLFDDALVDNPVTFRIVEQVEMAIRSMEKMFPPGVMALVQERLQSSISDRGFQSRAQMTRDMATNLHRIELAFHSLPREGVREDVRTTITHELMHVLESLGLITEDEIKILDAAIAKGPDPIGGPQEVALYKRAIRAAMQDDRMDDFEIEAQVTKELAQERRAFYMQQFANTGLSADEKASSIMARLLEVIERIRNFMKGLDYQSRDDVIRAMFRGDMARRTEQMEEAEIRNGLRSGLQVEPQFQLDVSEYLFDKVETTGKYTVGVSYDGGSVDDKLKSKYISYIFFHPDGSQAGFIDLKNKMPKGFEIEMIETKKGDGFSGMAFTNYVEQDLGIPMKLAGILLEDGFKQGMLFARKRAGIKDLKQFYQPVQRKDGTVQYYSPNKTREMVGLWTRIVGMMQTSEGVQTVNAQFSDVLKAMVQPGATAVKMEERMTQKRAIAILASWKAFEKRFPPEVWSSPALEHMFQLDRNVERDGVLGVAARAGMEENGVELLQAMDGPSPGPKGMTAQEMYQEKLARYKAEVAAERGWEARDVGEPLVKTQFMLETMKNAWRGVEGSYHEKAGTHPKRLNQHLGGVTQDMDRMNAFWKWTISIGQLAFKNPHIPGLKHYEDHKAIMMQIAMQWVRRAEETAKTWESVGAKQRDAISKTMFDFAEMKYRSSAEVQAKAIRPPRGWPQFLAGQPAALEVDAILRANGVEKKNHRLVQQIARDFQDFLNEVERLRVAELQKTFANNPAELQAAMQKLATEMGEFRAKPYFPMMRFGQFTAVVRDGTSGKIVWAAAYDNQAQRDAAVPEIRKQYPGDDITIGRASETAAELMGLPGPLLRIIRAKLNADPATALTPQQEAEIQEFEMLNGPDTTFAKRWMPSQGMPGYSMDGFRAYANYFQNGSRYLARLAKMDDLKASIEEVNQSFRMGGIANFGKRQMIVDYMNAHYKYIMEPGQDSGKLRAFVSLWYLGFSVTAAGMNLMQLPTVTFPILVKHFGRRVIPEFTAAINAGKNTVKLRRSKQGVGDPAYLKAREEAIRQGVIDVGQAAELGGFAEGFNLHRLLAGDKVQKVWRNTSWLGMYMFGFIEQYNREVTFQMAFTLAKKNPNVKAVQAIDSQYAAQVVELQARTGMSWSDAVSFLFAKEMVNQTQFSYDKGADPQFMRGKKKDLFIFFKFTQNMLFTLTHNGYGTAAHMMLLYLAVFGLQGLPGSEDLNELLRLLAKQFGFNVDFHQEARKFVREMTRGSVFDKEGPDLFMHGISRYGMGPALFTEHYWPQFDVSANGSMGRIIPGMAELFHGMATDKKFADVFAESAQKASGAAYGMVFPLMKYIMEPPGTADSKKWEALLPRFAKGFTKAYRHAGVELPFLGPSPGAETDSTGAKLVKFDITDMGDLLTVVTTALGAQPRKANEVYEMLRETRDVMDYYQARRVALYAQLDKALRVGDTLTIIDVTQSMAKYNQEVIDSGYPSMALKTNQIIQSLKQRATGRVMQENFLARNRSQIPVSQKIMDMWPGIEQGRKVK